MLKIEFLQCAAGDWPVLLAGFRGDPRGFAGIRGDPRGSAGIRGDPREAIEKGGSIEEIIVYLRKHRRDNCLLGEA